jgi:hypothetical protein
VDVAYIDRSTKELGVRSFVTAYLSTWSYTNLGTPTGKTIDDAPTMVSWGGDRLDVFVRTSDGGAWHKAFDGSSWSGWDDLGGLSWGRLAVVAPASGKLDIAIRGYDNNLWLKSWDPSVGGWYPSHVGWSPLPSAVGCSTSPVGTTAYDAGVAGYAVRFFCTEFGADPAGQRVVPHGRVWSTRRAGAPTSLWANTDLGDGLIEGSANVAGAADGRVTVWIKNAWNHWLYRRDYRVAGGWDSGWTFARAGYATEAPTVFALPGNVFVVGGRSVDEPYPVNTTAPLPVEAWSVLYTPGQALNGGW